MTSMKKLQFTEHIAAPVERVWQALLAPDSYREWTSAFCEGSYYEGSWEQGQRIRFLSPSGDGMVSEIAENRPHAFISIRHLGVIAGGQEDFSSDAVAGWAGALENYRLRPAGGGTEVTVEQDMAADHEQMMREAWPKALAKLKALCERS